ncbi:MAG: CBS domain-containing protein [Candidatus Sericytochromatia bacterium]|nr:CBS domain-containing protein [Candidatus Sericytochromatia bacterium]
MTTQAILIDPASPDGLGAALVIRRLVPEAVLVPPAHLPPALEPLVRMHGDMLGLADAVLPEEGGVVVWHPEGQQPGMPVALAERAETRTVTLPAGALSMTAGLLPRLRERGIALSPMEATLLYLAVMDGCRGFPGTVELEALTRLLEAGADRELASRWSLLGPEAVLRAPLATAVTVGSLMSHPVRTVEVTTTVAAAWDVLTEHPHGSLVVVDAAGAPMGLVLRPDVARAVRHALSERPVREVMSPCPALLTPGSGAEALLPVVLGPGPGKAVVVEDGGVVGIVSRSDVMGLLYAHRLPPSLRPATLAERLRRIWPASELDLLERIRALAGDQPLYLVGGAVRDLLLDRPSFDLDLMTDKLADAFVTRLGKALDAEVIRHQAFGTATLRLPDGRRIDVATARKETYRQPGALPEVQAAGLRHDLGRRDFTVNALALRIDGEAFGEVVDFFGGVDDLESGHLRTLHNLSFIEDPTRLVRGVRFAMATGLRFHPETEGFARYATSSGRLDGVGGERLKNELRKLLTRGEAAAGVQALADLDAWRLVSGALAGWHPSERFVDRLAPVTAWLAEQGEEPAEAAFLLVLGGLLAQLEDQGRADALARLHLPGGEQHRLTAALSRHARLEREHPGWFRRSPSERYQQLADLERLGLALMALLSETGNLLPVLDEHLAHRRLEVAVDGDWLRQQGLPPGPRTGEVLRRVRAALIDGKVATAADQQAFARTLLAEGEERA